MSFSSKPQLHHRIQDLRRSHLFAYYSFAKLARGLAYVYFRIWLAL